MSLAQKQAKLADGTQKPFWQSQNFWSTLSLLIAGAFVGLSPEVPGKIVGAVFGLISAVALVSDYVRSGVKVNLKEWLLDTNTVAYLATILVGFFPAFNPSILPELQNVLRELLGGNWVAAISALFMLIPQLVKMFKRAGQSA